MYLNDKDIRLRLTEMGITTPEGDRPFNPDEQIQPCTIDLRLSDVFWEPNSWRPIDLRRPHLLQVAPKYHWRRKILKSDECITLRPGQMILARTFEKFTIPKDCAGGIEGRSSFARMGLAIHCTGEFINPGYRGHMTLQLVNQGVHTIKIPPYIFICQLKLVKLTGVPEHLYGEEFIGSKYFDDNGGPSYWWKDRRIKSVQDRLKQSNAALRIEGEIVDVLVDQEPGVIERFDQFISSVSPRMLESTEIALNEFAKREDKTRLRKQLLRSLPAITLSLSGSFGAKLLFENPHPWYSYIIWPVAVLSIVGVLLLLKFPQGEYLGEKELRKVYRPKSD